MPGRLSVSSFYILILFTVLSASCVMNKLNESHQTISLNPSFSGAPVAIDIVKGPQWSRRMQAGPFIFNLLPQIVIWSEDEQGNLIETLYVTGADGRGFRHAGKKDKGSLFYRESFPLWTLKMDEARRELPSNEHPYSDSVTSATPESDFTLNTLLPGSEKVITLRLEINQSDDVNEFYRKEDNDWAGQPALIYEAKINSPGPKQYKMEVVGHSGLIGERVTIYKDLSGFDTALEQIGSIVIQLE